MAWRILLACLVLAGGYRSAAANGRPPGTSSIAFRQGHESDVAIGLTFGVLISHDGGKTWGWMCEDAVHYSGVFDPRYVFTQSGALFATTPGGLRVVRDSCAFNLTSAGMTFTSTTAQGPDGAFYYAAVQPADPAHQIQADYSIYKSTDDGMTFPTKGTPTPLPPPDPPPSVSFWESLEVAPGDPQRLYLSGYGYEGTVIKPLVFRSDNAGQDWTQLLLTNVTIPDGAVVRIAGIAKDNPDLVYIRIGFAGISSSDAIYRSTDKGVTWTLINSKAASIGAFVVRAALNSKGKHDVIVGTQALGAEISHDDGDTWTPLADPPHMNCLVENAAGELWACTQNYGVAGSVPSDDAGVMKTTDLVTWTKVLRYQNLTEAVTCPAGSVQQDTCVARWCAVCGQLGCTPPPSYGCPVPTEAPGPVTPPANKGGCCDSGSGGAGALALGLWVGMVLLRPRGRPGS